MINRSPRSTIRPFRILLAAALVLWASHAGAQRSADEEDRQRPSFGDVGAPPDFVPPPPPDFAPPPPPGARPDRTAPADTPSPAAPGTNPPGISEEGLLQRGSDIIDPESPEMQEVIGMIRIPEMGTNEVLQMLENLAGKPILRQQTLPSVKITFFSQSAMTLGEAITAIESLLALNGIAITNLGEDFLKAVPSAVINQQVARVWEGTTLNAVPTQALYEKIFELDFLDTQEAAQLLQPLPRLGQ